jgi:MFS family permease
MTYGVVSGMWTSAISLGAFVGPSLGGVLLDSYGFSIASGYPLLAELLIVRNNTVFKRENHNFVSILR